MTEHIQNLGWFIRRSPGPARLAAFYNEAIGLPILRRSADSVSLWIGETTVMEILPGDAASAAYADRNQARCYPIFRCYDFERLWERVGSSEARVIMEDFRPRLGYFLDPDGNVTGLHERPATTKRPE